jgi:aarF domain-containing kinase
MPLRDLPRVLRGAALVGREVLRLAESGQILSSQIGWHPRTPAPIIRAAERKPRSGESSAAGSSAAGPTWPSSPVAKPEVAAAAPPPQPSPDAIPPVVAEPAGPPPWPRMTLDGNTEPDELRAPSLPTSAAPDSKPPPDPSEPPAAKAKGSSHRRVPVHPATRALHFGGLGLGLAAGAAAAAVRQTITGEKQANLLMSEANVERLAGTLCRLRGAALKVGQMLSFNDADVLPPPVRHIVALASLAPILVPSLV